MREIAVLYSGGTDSTCAAVLMLKEFDVIHLLTFQRFGIFHVENAFANVEKIKDRFPGKKIIHKVINIDKLFKEISYSGYAYYFKKYGFFMLTTCGLCKLTMHIRALIYCRENNIPHVCDGANKMAGGGNFPLQMLEVISQLRQVYARYKITYLTPVFDFEEPQEIGWMDKLGLIQKAENQGEMPKNTSGKLLFDFNFFSEENIKGSKEDRKMQPRCFQLVLFNLFLYWYFLPRYGQSKYKKMAVDFYKEKIGEFSDYANGKAAPENSVSKGDL